jgi:hypothetical protein
VRQNISSNRRDWSLCILLQPSLCDIGSICVCDVQQNRIQQVVEPLIGRDHAEAENEEAISVLHEANLRLRRATRSYPTGGIGATSLLSQRHLCTTRSEALPQPHAPFLGRLNCDEQQKALSCLPVQPGAFLSVREAQQRRFPPSEGCRLDPLLLNASAWQTYSSPPLGGNNRRFNVFFLFELARELHGRYQYESVNTVPIFSHQPLHLFLLCSLNTINDDPSQTIGIDLFDSLSDNLFGPSLPSSFDPWLVDPFVVRSLAQSECYQNKLSRSQNCPQNTWYGKDRC